MGHRRRPCFGGDPQVNRKEKVLRGYDGRGGREGGRE